MQIQLKQREIAEALKMFITSQGINLAGKTVNIEFTSGRKDNGLSAEMTIEDAVTVGDTTVSTNRTVVGVEDLEISPTAAPDPAETSDGTSAPKPSLFK